MKTIDISNIQTVKALHIYLAYRLDLPAHYGRNLDALHDVLTERGERIALTGEAAGEEMARYLVKMRRMLDEMD